jgi:hypothetical protein
MLDLIKKHLNEIINRTDKKKTIKIEYNYIEGHLNDSLISILNRKIGQYTIDNFIRIGITGRDPEQRLREHSRDLDDFWDRMIVIYRTSSEKNIREIERILTNSYKDFIYYEKLGGGGFISKVGPNYLYLLLRKDKSFLEKLKSYLKR